MKIEVTKRVSVAAGLAAGAATASMLAAELQPGTIAAFDRYVRVSEAQMTSDSVFLRVDSAPETERSATLAALKRGELLIERLETNAGGAPVDVPGGLIHHWVGSVFVTGATVDQSVALLQDYNRHAEIYSPAVARSELLSHSGDVFRVALRFRMKKVITVVVNTENEARFSRTASDRAQSAIYSTRVAEVDEPDTPSEREKPVGHDGGYLWRLNTYWRFLERDAGTYVQCESITLTPGNSGWIWVADRPVRHQHSTRIAGLHARDNTHGASAAGSCHALTRT